MKYLYSKGIGDWIINGSWFTIINFDMTIVDLLIWGKQFGFRIQNMKTSTSSINVMEFKSQTTIKQFHK